MLLAYNKNIWLCLFEIFYWAKNNTPNILYYISWTHNTMQNVKYAVGNSSVMWFSKLNILKQILYYFFMDCINSH